MYCNLLLFWYWFKIKRIGKKKYIDPYILLSQLEVCFRHGERSFGSGTQEVGERLEHRETDKCGVGSSTSNWRELFVSHPESEAESGPGKRKSGQEESHREEIDHERFDRRVV